MFSLLVLFSSLLFSSPPPLLFFSPSLSPSCLLSDVSGSASFSHGHLDILLTCRLYYSCPTQLISLPEISSRCGPFPGKEAWWPDCLGSFSSYNGPLAFTPHWPGQSLSQFQQLFSDWFSVISSKHLF